MNNRLPFVIGHRGACGHAPENTLSSIRKAAELGARCVEFDAMLSADKRIILFHDDDLERITGKAGLTAETSFDDLRKLDAGSWFSEAYSGERIPTLADAVSLLSELDLGAVIEIKPSDGTGVITGQTVSQAVRDDWPEKLPDPIISSFNEDSLAQALSIAPNVPRALNVYKNLDDWQDKLTKFGCVALHCKEHLVSERIVAMITEAGYDLRCFTVNDPERARKLKNWGVSSVFTDFPDRLIDI